MLPYFVLSLVSSLTCTDLETLAPTYSLGDYDQDGLFDVYVVHPGGCDALFHNLGDGSFEDVTAAVGLAGDRGSRDALWEDFDGDGKLDLYVSSYARTSKLYQNTGTSFVDVSAAAGFVHGAEQDAEWLDFDQDQRMDLWVATALGDRLYRNEAHGRFELVPLVEVSETVVSSETAIGTEGSEGTERSELAAAAAPGQWQPGAAGPRRGHGGGLRLPQRASRTTRGSRSNAASAPAGVSLPLTACALKLRDVVAGTCSIEASTTPALGRLYPLSADLNVSASGNVGIGTTAPTAKLHVSANSTGGSSARFENNASTGFSSGVVGVSNSTTFGATGVMGIASSSTTTNNTFGVWGASYGPQGVGVYGDSGAGSGNGKGVWGHTSSPYGYGVYATASATTGDSFGVYGNNSSSSGIGVAGSATSTTGLTYGVRGVNDSTSGAGVYGLAQRSGAGQAIGVLAISNATSGIGLWSQGSTAGAYGQTSVDWGAGVWGDQLSATALGAGVRGRTASPSGYGVVSEGNFAATGAKLFVNPHPTDPSKEIRYVCLEGNESGTYFRGSGRLTGGRAAIEVPEDFRLVSEPEGLTVQVTPIGAPARLWIEAQDLHQVIVRGDLDVSFHYFVNGVRRGFAGHQPIAANTSYVPRERGVPFGTQYPDELRAILVQNGILSADFTPNEATAAALGWPLAEPPQALPATVVGEPRLRD